MPLANSQDIKPDDKDPSFQRKSGDKHAFQVQKRQAAWLAIEDDHFLPDSALFLPTLAPDSERLDGLLLIGMILIRARDNPIEKCLLTWHSSSSADVKLAEARGTVVMHLMKGETAELAALALAEKAAVQEAGLLRLLDFTANWLGWRCESCGASKLSDDAAKAAVAEFQRAYSAAPFGEKLQEEPPAKETWEALFKLQQRRLAELCVVAPDQLPGLRGKLQFTAKKQVGCEDKQPLDSAAPPGPKLDGEKSASARRVEVLFVRGSEEPELKCHASGCDPKQCDLFSGKIYKHLRVSPKWAHIAQVVPYLAPGSGAQEIHYKIYGLEKDKVTLKVLDGKGQVIHEQELTDVQKKSGAGKLQWDGVCTKGAGAGKLFTSAGGPFQIELATGADFDRRPFSGDIVDPKVQAEYLVVPRDRELAKAQPAGEDALKPATVVIEVWLAPRPKTQPFDKGAVLTVKGAGAIELFSDEDLKKPVDRSLPLAKDQVNGGKRLKLWARGTTAGTFELSLAPEGGVTTTTVKMAVVDLCARGFRYGTENPPKPKEATVEEKIKDGLPLHLQTSDNDFGRVRLLIDKIDAAAWPDETDDYELVLAVPKDSGKGGAVKVFDAREKGAEQSLPLKLKKKDLVTAQKELWIEGKALSTKARDLALDLGLDRKDGGPAKKPKEGADRLYLTVYEFEKVAPSKPVDLFTSPTADYKADKHLVYVNTQAEGRKITLKTQIKPAVAGVTAYFLLAPGDKNGLREETGVDVPAAMKDSTGAAWTWDKIDVSLQRKDKKATADYWHLSAKTDDKGAAEVEVELSQIGSDVFYAGVYGEQDPELAKFKHADQAAKKPTPVLSKKLTVWRKLWYQLAKAKTCQAPAPDRMVAAYERAKVEVVACATKEFEKADITVALQPVTFYPEWMVKVGGGDDEVAVVGSHNKAEFNNNLGKYFPSPPGVEEDLKGRVVVIDYQWDPTGWTALKQPVVTSKTSGDIDMGAKVVKPALRGPLINTGIWIAYEKKAAGNVEVQRGNLADANILIEKPRSSLNNVKVKLPDEADKYLLDLAKYEVKVQLKLAKATSYLGEAFGSIILAVYDPTNIADYHDTVAHELGHKVKQTTRQGREPKGQPEHPYWNDGGQGVHCSSPTVPTVRDRVKYPKTSPAMTDDEAEEAAQAAAKCLMFSAGPVPNANNRFCDTCHHYLLAQDMTRLG